MEARTRYLGMDLAAVPGPARAVWSTLAGLSLCIFCYHFREGRWVKSDRPAARACRWLADDSTAQLVRRATGQFFVPRVGEPRPLKPVDTAL